MNTWDERDRRARLAGHVSLAAVFALVQGIWAVQISQSWGPRYVPLDIAAATAVCLFALARGRGRIWVASAGLIVAAGTVLTGRLFHLPAEPGPGMVLALCVLVASSVRRFAPPAAAGIAFAGFAVVVGTDLAAPPARGFAAVSTLNATGWLVALAIGLGLRVLDARRRGTQEQVRRDERLEVARELHDVVAHHISGIVLQAQAAQVVARRNPENLAEALSGIEAAGSDALTAMRRVVGLLRDVEDGAPSSTPAPERLGELVERFNDHGPQVRLTLPPEENWPWPPEVISTVYRVVQESLTNIVRHAPQARSVTVDVTQDEQVITIEVSDDAPPAVPHYQRAGYGLIGMRERLEALGGTLRVGPAPDAGWRVQATLPAPAVRTPVKVAR